MKSGYLESGGVLLYKAFVYLVMGNIFTCFDPPAVALTDNFRDSVYKESPIEFGKTENITNSRSI